MNIVSSDCNALGADYIGQHCFHLLVRGSSRTFTVVWTRRPVVLYRPVYYDFFVIVDGCLWPVLTALSPVSGVLELLNGGFDGLFGDDALSCEDRVSGER